jgi:hypothetical protein
MAIATPALLPVARGGKCGYSTCEGCGLDRLGQIIIEACGDRALAVLCVRVGGHRRDRHAVPECCFERTDLAQNRVPVAGGIAISVNTRSGVNSDSQACVRMPCSACRR